MKKKLFIAFFNLCFLLSCQGEVKTKLPVNSSKYYTDFEITKIDSLKIGEEIVENKRKFINLLCKSFEKDYTVPDLDWNIFQSSEFNVDKISIKKYENINIKEKEYPSYLFSFLSENDQPYTILLLTNSTLTDGVIIFELFENEAKFLRTSSLDKQILSVKLLFIYDPNSELISEEPIDNQHDSIIICNNKYIVDADHFLDYFQENNGLINKNWKDKDSIYSYSLKGKIANHLKQGYWSERAFELGYGTQPIWRFGKYENGLKSGEWFYSIDDFQSINKEEIYQDGELKEVLLDDKIINSINKIEFIKSIQY